MDLPDIDTDHAHPARVYDYLLGGKDNYGADRNAAVRAAISRLTDRERHVLSLVHVQELQGAEIGRMLGISESRVSQILSGIRSKLKHQLDAYETAA